MASSTESDCHKDPNFAVICSFLDKYGESLGLPHVSYLDLARYLQDTTDNVSRVLIDIHVRLLRRIGKSSVSSDRFEKSIIKILDILSERETAQIEISSVIIMFCHHFSEFDAWEVESYGYKHANIKTKLRILKNLLECQFDFNLKFKEKVNESSAEEMRFLPIGRDKEGQAYWYFLDKDLNLLIYKEEQDDEDADTWQLVCSDRQQLEKLVNSLKIDATSEVKEDDDKISSESRSSKEGSPDRDETAVKKESHELSQVEGTENSVKQEPESIVKEEPVERDKKSVGIATESPGIKQKPREHQKCVAKNNQTRDLKLGCKVELNVNIERLSAERLEKYKKRNGNDKHPEGTTEDQVTSVDVDPEVELAKAEQQVGDRGENKESMAVDSAVASCVDKEQKTASVMSSNDSNDQSKVSTHEDIEAGKGNRAEDCVDACKKDSKDSQSKQDHSLEDTSANDKKEEGKVSDEAPKELPKSLAETGEVKASDGPEQSDEEERMENSSEKMTVSTERSNENQKCKEPANSPETASETLRADRDHGNVLSIVDSSKKSDTSHLETKKNPALNLTEKKEGCDDEKVMKEVIPESEITQRQEGGKEENALMVEQKKNEIALDKSENSTCDLSNKEGKEAEKVTKESTDEQKDKDAEKVTKESNDEQKDKEAEKVTKESTDEQKDKEAEKVTKESNDEQKDKEAEKVTKESNDEQKDKEAEIVTKESNDEQKDEEAEKVTKNSNDGQEDKEAEKVAKERNNGQKDKEAEKVTKITQDDDSVKDSLDVSTQEPSCLTVEKDKVLQAESVRGQQTDAIARATYEEKEKTKDVEHESGTTQSSSSDQNLTSNSKKSDKDVCLDPTQTELLKDPDKEKSAIVDTGTEDVTRKSPLIPDVEEDFEEAADDHEMDEDFSVDAQASGKTSEEAAKRAESTSSTAARVPLDEAKSPNSEGLGSESKKVVQANDREVKDATDGIKQTAIEDSQEKSGDCKKSDEKVEEKSSLSQSTVDVKLTEHVKPEKEESNEGEKKAGEVPLESKPQTNGTAVSDGQARSADDHIANAKSKEVTKDIGNSGEKNDFNAEKVESSDDAMNNQINEQHDNGIPSSEPKLVKEDIGTDVEHKDSSDSQIVKKTANTPEEPSSEKKQISSKTHVVENSMELLDASKPESLKNEKTPSLPNGLEAKEELKAVTEELAHIEENQESGSQSKADNKVAKSGSETQNDSDGKIASKAASVKEPEIEKAPSENVKGQESSCSSESTPDEQSVETPPLADATKTTAGPDEEKTMSSKKSDTFGNEGKEALKKGEKGETKADIEAGAKNFIDEKKSDMVDSKISEETTESQKEARGSETQRKLKRAAPEPASDEMVDSEPNGKRARPTTRVQKTRGGRNAAARGRATRLENKESESEDSESVVPPTKSRRGGGRGRGRGARGRGRSRNQSAAKEEAEVGKAAAEDNEEDTSDQAGGKRAKKKKPDSSSEALSEEEVTPAKKGRSQIQSRNTTRGALSARGSRRGGRGGAKGVVSAKKATPASAAVSQEEDGSRRRSARVREMKARRPPTPSSPEEESEPTEEEEEDEEEDESDPDKYFLEASFTPEEESGDEEFKPKGRNFQRQAARTTQEKNEEVINDDTPCVKCGKYNHPEMILLCDKCDAGYHTACLRPPLMLIPDGDWFCPPCEHSMLVEKLFACLQSLDIAVKKKDRLMKRQERLAYVGISINNILHGDRPCQVTEKFSGKRRGSLLAEDQEEEEEEDVQSEAFSSYESEEEIPERKFRSERLALRQAEKRSRREKYKRRKPSRAQSPDMEVYAKRTCRTRNTVSYQFKEFDELISNAIDDDQPVRKEKPPGRSRGKDMSNILGASDEEDERIRQRDMENGEAIPIPVIRKKPKRRLTKLDDSEEEEQDDDSEEFKLSEDEDSDATEVEEEEEGDDDDLTEENSDSGDWKPKKTWYNSRNNRTSSRRKKFVVDDDDDYESDENASKRRSTRNSTRGRIKYDDWDSEEEEETELETEEVETSFSDLSSDDSRFARKMKKEREKRKLKEGKKKRADADEEESEGSVSDSSMVRKRKMLMKLVKRRRKDESGNEDSESRETSKSRIKSRKSKRKQSSDDSSATVDEDDSGEEESDEPRMKKKNVLRSSDEEDVEKASSEEAAVPNQKTEVAENCGSMGTGAVKLQQSEDPQAKTGGKRESPSKAASTGKGKKRGDGTNLKADEVNENKDEPVPGKVRRVSGSDKEGAAELNLSLEAGKKALPARRTRASSREGAGGEASADKKSSAAGNRRSSTDKQTRSGKKKKLPNFLDVPSGGESDDGEVKPQDMTNAATSTSKPDQPVSSAQPMPSGAPQPSAGPRFQPPLGQGPQVPGYPPNQHFGNAQGHQFNPAFAHGQMVQPPPHMRPGLSSPPHTMSNVSNAGSHESSSSMTQMPSHYSAPQGHPGNTAPTAAGGMRGPYPRYNSMPPSQMPQGMPPHMMNQALEPGQIPPSMSQSSHIRHPQSMPHQPPHGMGHDPRMAHQQQWADHRGPGQPPAYGNSPRMPYPHEMVPQQPFYHMRSPPPHSMGGQYPPGMSNPLTSMGQMTRNLSPGMKSPPPRPAGSEAGEDQKAPPPQDVPVKSEVKQEMAEKEREAESASPEKAPAATGKPGGKRAKASSPKSHSEKPPEGEEASGMSKGQGPNQPSSVQSSQPTSTAHMPYYQQHPYMNSQQGFYMPQHYRPPPYGGPNQGPPMNQMPGMFPPHHNQYMNPNHPFPTPQGHQAYPQPAGQQQQQHQQQQPGMPPNMPPSALSSQNQNAPPNTMPGQPSQPGMTPSQTMQPSGMPPNPSLPANHQRPGLPQMNTGQQPAGPPSGPATDANRMSAIGAAYQQQRQSAGMPPLNQMPGGPGMMPGGPMRPPTMPHQAGPSPHGMPPGPMGPVAGQPYHSGPQQAVQAPPPSAQAQTQASPQRVAAPTPAQGQDSSQGPAAGITQQTQQTQQAPVNLPLHQQGKVPNLPPTSQASEPASGQGLHGQAPQTTGPYYPAQPVPAPNLPPPTPEATAVQQSQGESAKTPAEPCLASPNSGGNQKTQQVAEATQEQKPTPEVSAKEEPKGAQQEEPSHKLSQTQEGTANLAGKAAAAAAPPGMPVSQSHDPNAMVNPSNRNFPPNSMGQVHPGGQGPPMPYYNPGPYYQPYGNMPPQSQQMHPQGRWGPGMPPFGPPRFGGHSYPPYGMGPEAMNMSMIPGQGMHGNAGVPPHPQSTGNPSAGGPMGTPPHSGPVPNTPPHSGPVPNTPPHPGAAQDFQAPRDQPAAVRNRRSSSTDSRSNAPPATGSTPHQEGPQQDPAAISNSSQPQSSPSVTSSSSFGSSTSVKSEQLTTVSSPSASSVSTTSASASASTTVASAVPPPQQASSQPLASISSSKPSPSNLAGPMPSSENQQNFQQEAANNNNNPPAPAPPMSMVGPQSGGWASGPNMNQPQYSHTMGLMHRMGAPMPGAYNVMPPYGPQGMMLPQAHNPYMMGPANPGQPPNNAGQGHGGNFEHYQGHMAPLPPHGMAVNQLPMNYNGGYRPPYMPQGQEHPAMPPRSDFGAVDMQSRPNAPDAPVVPSSDSQTNEGNIVAPKAKRAKTQKKKDTNPASSPRSKGTRGRGRGRGGFMIDSLLQARGAGREDDDGEETGEMKDIVNYVTTDEYIKQQTSS